MSPEVPGGNSGMDLPGSNDPVLHIRASEQAGERTTEFFQSQYLKTSVLPTSCFPGLADCSNLLPLV